MIDARSRAGQPRRRRGLVTGIANDQSIAWGCAKAFRGLGAELAVTYLNEKAKPYVEPLARQLEAELVLPLDLRDDGQLEAVFDQITERWGRLDFLLHSIAFAPDGGPAGPRRRLLQGGLPAGDGDLLLVLHPHGPAGRAADGPRRHAVLHDLLRLADGGRALQPDGPGQGGAGERHALPGGRARPQGHPRPCDLAGAAQDPRRLGHRPLRRAAEQSAGQGADAAAWSRSTMSAWPPPISPPTPPS